MTISSLMLLAILGLFCATCTASESLVKNGKCNSRIAILASEKEAFLMDRAAQAIADTVNAWSGVKIPIEKVERLPEEPAIILSTLDSLVPELGDNTSIYRAEFMDDHGFAIVPILNKVFIVSQTARGVYNGAVYLRDFKIDGSKVNLILDAKPVYRTPWMKGRAVYLLNIWGHEPLYTVSDWKVILDSLAWYGFETVYFWTSGHFPSKKFPQTYKWVDHDFDSTAESKIASVQDLAQIIEYGHRVGLRMYLGGGLGAWTGTGNLTSLKPETMKTGGGMAAMSLCPSHPESRKAIVEYYKEMYDALPKADGLYIELADEFGECVCEICSKPVDAFGSRQFGQSQITLVQEIAHTIWKDHPHAHFAFTNGYDEHKNDPAFYEAIKQMDNSKFEWMEARGSWEFPAAGGKLMPAPYFSKKQMKWKIWEIMPLSEQVEIANRLSKEGWFGMIADFSPGFSSGSLYGGVYGGSQSKLPVAIPFPVNKLPFALTYFVTREVMWDPTLTVEQVKERIQRRFFGAEAPAHLSTDLWDLREILLVCSQSLKTSAEHAKLLESIEEHIREAENNASPKTLESLSIMKEAVDMIRKYTEPE